MKRIIKFFLTALLILFVPVASTIAQEQKSTKKIKVIVEDKEGSRVIIDSTFNSMLSIDTIRTKDGNMIFIGKHDGNSDAEKNGNEMMLWTLKEKGSNGSVIYINEGSPVKITEGGKRFSLEVISEDGGQGTQKSNYVIAKDGMVITIEGGDEEKVRKMGELIETQMGSSKDDSKAVKPSVIKEETKKTTKK